MKYGFSGCAFAFATLVLSSSATSSASAEVTGWPEMQLVGVRNPNEAALSAQQVRLVVDTAALVAAGKMHEDGRDIRLSPSCDGSASLPYWIEPNTMNSAATVIWVKADLPSGTTTLFLFSGNPEASPASDAFGVFDGDSALEGAPFGAAKSVDELSSSGSTFSQRGLRFKPTEDLLLVGLGKNAPDGATRYVTLFSASSQQKLLQMQVSGPAETFSYASSEPRWLTPDQTYILSLYQGGSGSHTYYHGELKPHHLDSRLGFLDTRYCNSCDQDTFPAVSLASQIYGLPSFQFLTYKRPELALEQTAGACTNTALCDSDCSLAQCGDGHVNAEAGEACDDGNDDDSDGCLSTCVLATCGDGSVQAGVEACDDGNADDSDGCLSTCVPATCGDGSVQAGVEACDDGNADDSDGCLSDCTLPEQPGDGDGDGDGDGEQPGDGDGEQPGDGDGEQPGDGDGEQPGDDDDAGPEAPSTPKKSSDSGCSLSAPGANDASGLFALVALGLGAVTVRRRRRA